MGDPYRPGHREKRALPKLRPRELLRIGGLALLALVLAFSASYPGRVFWNRLFLASGFGGVEEVSGLRVHVIDVGKADAILFQCEGKAGLIDAGAADSGDTVVDYLARHGIAKLDFVVMSHPDSDHIGGMAQVVREVPVEEFLFAALTEEEDSLEYSALFRELERSAVPRRALEQGDSFSLGTAAFTVLGPFVQYEDTNNASLVCRLTYQGFTALFCGDIEGEAELDYVKSGVGLAADLLKVPHHGSASSCSKRFVEAVSPRYAVVSVGPDRNELPRDEPLRRLEEAGAEIYRTDTDGTVVFTVDQGALAIETEK